jgi:hypothetical protein
LRVPPSTPLDWRAPQKQKTRLDGGLKVFSSRAGAAKLLLPRALFMAISLQALSALVLVHLQPTFLFQITHVTWKL